MTSREIKTRLLWGVIALGGERKLAIAAADGNGAAVVPCRRVSLAPVGVRAQGDGEPAGRSDRVR